MNIILTDSVGEKICFDRSPNKIISLVPSLSELLCDLGLEEKIVGITKFCVHPPALKQQKTIVGGTKNVRCEKIKALSPDLIIANKEENTLEMVSQLRHIAPVYVTDIMTINDNLDVISTFGRIFDCEERAAILANDLSKAAAGFQKYMEDKISRKAAYFIWKDPYMAAGAQTFINELMSISKFDNLFQSAPRYPEIKLKEILVREHPEIILLSSEPYPFKEKNVLEMKEIFPGSKVFLVDGEMFSWYGSRPLKAFKYFTELQVLLDNCHKKADV